MGIILDGEVNGQGDLTRGNHGNVGMDADDHEWRRAHGKKLSQLFKLEQVKQFCASSEN